MSVVAVRRREDHVAAYAVYMQNAVTGEWLKIDLLGNQWTAQVHTAAACWKCYPAMWMTAGQARPGRANAWLNSRLTVTAGTWTAGAQLGNTSGLYVKYATATGAKVTCVVPAGHTHVAIRHVAVTNGKSVTVNLGGGQVDSFSSLGTSSGRITDRVIAIEPDAVDRALELVVGAEASAAFWLIGVYSWRGDGQADPRALAGDGLHSGNDLIATYNNVNGGYLHASVCHGANTYVYGSHRLWTPNTFELTIETNPGDGLGYRFSALAFHQTAADRPFVPTANPRLYVDGTEVSADMSADPGTAALPYGAVLAGSTVTVVCEGTLGAGGATTLVFTTTFSHNRIDAHAEVRFTNDCLVRANYLPSLAFGERVAMGLPEITGYVLLPGSLTKQNIKIAQGPLAPRCWWFPDGTPYVIEFSSEQGGYFTVADVAKIYFQLNNAALPTPANGVVWYLVGSMRVLSLAEFLAPPTAQRVGTLRGGRS